MAQQPPADRPSRSSESAEELAQKALDKIDEGQYEQAGALLGRARRLQPKLAQLDLVEGLLLIDWREQRNAAEAERKLRAYCTSNEGGADYRGYAALARIYMDSRSYREAVRDLEMTKKLAPLEEKGKPVRAQATMDLASAYMGLDRKKEAMEAAKAAVAIAPDEPDIQLGFAKVAGAAQEQSAAETAAKRAMELLKNKAKRQPFERRLYDSMKQCCQVQLNMKRSSIEKSPEDGALLASAALILVDQAEIDRKTGLLVAREIALQACEKDPRQHDWQVMVARIEIDLGVPDEAKRRLEEVRQAAPDNADAAKLLESLSADAPEQQQQ